MSRVALKWEYKFLGSRGREGFGWKEAEVLKGLSEILPAGQGILFLFSPTIVMQKQNRNKPHLTIQKINNYIIFFLLGFLPLNALKYNDFSEQIIDDTFQK